MNFYSDSKVLSQDKPAALVSYEHVGVRLCSIYISYICPSYVFDTVILLLVRKILISLPVSYVALVVFISKIWLENLQVRGGERPLTEKAPSTNISRLHSAYEPHP